MAAGLAEAQRPEYEHARELLNSGKPADAAAIYRKLSLADPNNANLLLNLSIAEYKAGQFTEAAASATAALKVNPGLLPARLFLGASYLETGQLPHAIEALDQVVAANPNERNGRLMLGEALQRAGHADRAVEQLQAASEMLPANSRVWYALGRSYEALGRRDDAAEAWKRLLALPPSVESHTHLAELNEAEHRWNIAAAEWTQALQLAPENQNVRIKLAWSLFRRRDYDEAISALKPLGDDARNADIPFLHGASLLNMQQPDQALPFLREALARDADSLPARAALGQALLQTGKIAEAIPLLEQARAGDHDGTVHFQLLPRLPTDASVCKAQQALADYRRLRSSARRRALIRFRNLQHLIRLHIFQNLPRTRRPANLDPVHHLPLPRPEVDSEVARRCITYAGGPVIGLVADLHHRAHAVAIAPGPPQLQNQPGILARTDIPPYLRAHRPAPTSRHRSGHRCRNRRTHTPDALARMQESLARPSVTSSKWPSPRFRKTLLCCRYSVASNTSTRSLTCEFAVNRSFHPSLSRSTRPMPPTAVDPAQWPHPRRIGGVVERSAHRGSETTEKFHQTKRSARYRAGHRY